MFSIIIPTWNNLPYLRLCVESLQKFSTFNNQLIIHVNEGSDGTLDWVRSNNLEHSFTETNSGVCVALNMAYKKATADYIVFMNDDMFALPGWDKVLASEISALYTDCFMLSATMIEPYNTGNNCVIVADYGKDPDSFNETKLLDEFASFTKPDWSGSTWPPAVVHRKWWEKVGGYSEEFSPGMASDDDFAMKMWKEGCRIYKGVSSSRVYHFISKSTGRIKKNDGKKQFAKKWGIKPSTFHKYYIRRGATYNGKLKAPSKYNPGLIFERISAFVRYLRPPFTAGAKNFSPLQLPHHGRAAYEGKK